MKPPTLFHLMNLALSASLMIAAPVYGLQEQSDSVGDLQPRQNVDWAFTVYQNQQCTGESDDYSGYGSIGCQVGDFLNGGIEGYTKTCLVGNCSVAFWGDDNCVHLVGLIAAGTGDTCQVTTGGDAVAYDVACD